MKFSNSGECNLYINFNFLLRLLLIKLIFLDQIYSLSGALLTVEDKHRGIMKCLWSLKWSNQILQTAGPYQLHNRKSLPNLLPWIFPQKTRLKYFLKGALQIDRQYQLQRYFVTVNGVLLLILVVYYPPFFTITIYFP